MARPIDDGLRALYDLDYEAARQNFTVLAEKFPDDPIGQYALTTTHWWELTNEFDEQNPALEKKFIEAAERTVVIAREKIRRGDPGGEAHLCLGGALGLMSRWDAIQGHWFRAYRHGKQAFNAQEKALKINPQLHDAGLGVGIFHYYTATLPRVVKLLAKLVFGGNKEQGLAEIRRAMTQGRFSRTAAKLFLVGIYNNNEKNYTEALALVREGRQEFPRSSFFHFLEILTLENIGDWAAMRQEAESFIRRVESGDFSYRKKYLHRAYFALGNSSLGEKKPAEAVAYYDRVIRDLPSEDRWVTWTYLNRGKAHDLLGRREQALSDYRAVLQRRDVWGMHDQAEDYISRPYAGLPGRDSPIK